MWQKWAWLAAMGAAGTLARYALDGWVQRLGSGFPWGVLTVNSLGCFLFGIVWSLAEDRHLISPEVRLYALVGFMGAFTTFSTFAFETARRLNESQWLSAAGNILAHNLLGLVLMVLGLRLGRLI